MTEQEKIKELEDKIRKYEENGVAKLYYALQRKAWEMADLLNNTNLRTLALDDPKDKTFDRLKVVWNDASSIAAAVNTIGLTVSISGDETKDTRNPQFRITPESMADNIGEIAGRKQ